MADMRYMSSDGGPPNGGFPPNVFPGPFYAPTPVHEAQPVPVQAPAPVNHPQAAPQAPPPSVLQVIAIAPRAPPPAAAAAPAVAPPAANPPAHPRWFPGAYLPGSTQQIAASPDGLGYIFPPLHTTIHIIEESFPPWEHPGAQLRWRAYRVPINMTVKDLIGQLCPETGPQGQKFASRGITECLEVGGGTWLKGSEFWIGRRGDEGKMKERVGRTLAQIDWTERRGREAQPVWISLSAAYT